MFTESRIRVYPLIFRLVPSALYPFYGVFHKEIINKVIQCRSKPIQVNPTPKLIEAAPLEIYLVNKFNIAFSVKQ
jgi:hypothetical protein